MNNQIQDINIVILMSLRSSPKYPAQLIDAINSNVAESKQIKQATLYNYLKRLEEHNLIYSFWGDESRGGRRKYYQLTEYGKKFCENNFQSYNDIFVDAQISSVKENKPKKVREIPSPETQKEISKRLAQITSNSYTQSIEPITLTPAEVEKRKKAASLLFDATPNPPQPTATYSNNEVIPATNILINTYDNTIAQTTPPLQKTILKESVVQKPISQKSLNSEGNAINPNESANEKRYKDILRELVGDQLDKMPNELLKPDSENITKATPIAKKTTNKDATLTDIADILTVKGIKIKLYNKHTSTFKGTSFLYTNKSMTLSYILSFLFATLITSSILGIYYLLNGISGKNIINSYIICEIVYLIPAIVLLIIYLINPTKRSKPKFRFKHSLVNYLIGFAAVLLFIGALNLIVFKTVFTNSEEVFTNIILPLAISVSVPLYPICYYLLYNKMLTN